MYYIDRVTLTDASFLAGCVAEPVAGETVWAVGAHAVGDEVIRPGLHRVFKCAVARTVSDTLPPEQDATSWKDMRSTKRWTPLGPWCVLTGSSCTKATRWKARRATSSTTSN